MVQRCSVDGDGDKVEEVSYAKRMGYKDRNRRGPEATEAVIPKLERQAPDNKCVTWARSGGSAWRCLVMNAGEERARMEGGRRTQVFHQLWKECQTAISDTRPSFMHVRSAKSRKVIWRLR